MANVIEVLRSLYAREPKIGKLDEASILSSYRRLHCSQKPLRAITTCRVPKMIAVTEFVRGRPSHDRIEIFLGLSELSRYFLSLLGHGSSAAHSGTVSHILFEC